MAIKRHDFSASQKLYGIVEFLGWIAILASVAVGVLLAQFQPLPLVVGAVFAGCLGGLSVVLAAQMSKAIIVTAENSYELVDLARAAARQAKAESPSATPTLTARR